MDNAWATASTPYAATDGTTLLGVMDIATNRSVSLAGAVTLDDAGYSIVFNNNLSGSGSLTKTGNGTLTLTYQISKLSMTGPLTISSGTLKFATDFSQIASITDNGTLVAAYPFANSYSHVISGSGNLEVSAGNLMLSGLNTYTGITTVDAGATLTETGGVSGGQTQGSIAGNIVDNGILIFNRLDSVLYDGTISGSGTVQAANVGSLILTGDNTFTGTISGARIQIGNGGTTGSIVANANIGSQGLAFDRSDNYTYTGNVTGSATLAQIGSGTLTLAGTIGSGIVVTASSGTLVVSGDASLATATVATGAVLQIGNGGMSGTIGNVSNSGSMIFDRSDSYVSSGSLTGSGSLLVTGGGKLTVIGLDTFGAGVTIAPGTTVQVGDGTVVGRITANIVDNGALIYLSSPGNTSNNISGDISGAGTLQFAGQGTAYSVTGNISPLGGTTVTSGARLVVGNGVTTGSLDGPITDQGSIIFGRSDTYEFNGVISGSGQVAGSGQGTLIFTHDQSYTGGTTITSSTLQLGNGGTSGSVVGNIADNAILAFDRSDTATFSGTISGTGQVQQIGSGTIVLTGSNTYTGVTTISAGTLQLGNGGTSGSIAGDVVDNANLTFQRSDTLTYSRSISGTGTVTQAGTGTTLLDGQNPVTGLTTVTAGTLEVGDASNPGASLGGGVHVQSGGTLKGYGTVGSVTNDGIVAPGGSIGTLTVASFSQSSGGTLQIEVTPTAADRLHVTGAAALGGTLAISAAPGTYGTTSFTILDAASVTGTFSSVTGLPGGEAAGISYTSTGVTLTVTPTEPAVAFSDFDRSGLETDRQLNDIVMGHALSRGCNNVGGDMQRKGEGNCPEIVVWRQGFAGAAGYTGNATGFNTHSLGAIGGIEVHIDNGLVLGAFAAYSRTDLGVTGSSDNARTDSFLGGLSAGFGVLGGHLDANVHYLFNDGETRRFVTPSGGTTLVALAHPKSDVWGASTQFDLPVFADVDAFARLTYASLSRAQFTEAGAGNYDFLAEHADGTSTTVDLGARFSHVFTIRSNSIIVPELTAGLRGQPGSTDEDVRVGLATDALGGRFTVGGPSPDRLMAFGSAAVAIERTDGYAVFLRFDGEAGSKSQTGDVTIGGWFRF